ncbi:MAG: hypothetical protein QGG25_07695 [Phycisphaerae bacterium]|nr:hypothetical protein [Phycisphaerae bacterium]
MKRIILIACGKLKQPGRARAEDLYTGSLFRLSLRYARDLSPDMIFILSARYGLLDLGREVTPYDATLNRMSVGEIKAWSENVVARLREHADLHHDRFIFLAGDRYRRYIIPHLHSIEIPLRGLRIGEQLQFLKRQVSV